VRISNRKTVTGVVTSNKMEKTITVLVERRYKHPKYGKYILASRKYTAHDETNDALIGDEVEERGRFRKLRREVALVATILREREKGIRGAKPMGGASTGEE